MATEYPPLSKIHVVGYSANDKDYPILNQLLDPRVAGYKVPEDFSACPDKRYPNHIFTGAQPISGDQRVRHTWEILPSPWVPFTRYDDDLGPVQGKRRSVKNEGQQASLTSSTKISYEGREGSSIVLIESEETWSIKTDDDGNSLFPVKIRDFYDPSRGAVEERRQLFVPTGEEVASLENVNGIITQTSYEPYNEFLSYKIVQTYAVSGPQLVGNSTNNEGQLVTVTRQRKASDGYVAPQPTATRTVETSREDAESLIETIVEAPSVFDEKLQSVEKPDIIPSEFRASSPNTTISQVIEGQSTEVTIGYGQLSQTKQRIQDNKVRETTVTRPSSYGSIAGEFIDGDGVKVNRTKTLSRGQQTITPSATTSGSVEGIGDGYTVKTLDTKSNVFDNKSSSVSKEENIPVKFRAEKNTETTQTIKTQQKLDEPLSLKEDDGEREKTQQRLTEWTIKETIVSRDSKDYSTIKNLDLDENWNISIPFDESIEEEIDYSAEASEYEGIGDEKYIKKTYDLDQLEERLGSYSIVIPTKINLDLPRKLRSIEVDYETKSSSGEQDFVQNIFGSFDSISLRDNGMISSTLSIIPNFKIIMDENWARDVDAEVHIFFLKKEDLSKENINNKVGAQGDWPKFAPNAFSTSAFGYAETKTLDVSKTRGLSFAGNKKDGFVESTETKTDISQSSYVVPLEIPPCIRGDFIVQIYRQLQNVPKQMLLTFPPLTTSEGTTYPATNIVKTLDHSITLNQTIHIPATPPTQSIPTSGKYVINSSIEPYRFDWFLVRSTVLDASNFAF